MHNNDNHTHKHYIRKNYNEESIKIVNNLIRGFNSIPLDPTLLVRQSKCPKITYFNERRAQCKYHQFHNYKKNITFWKYQGHIKKT